MADATRITFAAEAEWNAWTHGWTTQLLSLLPDAISVESVHIHLAGRNQLSLDMRMRGRSTRVRLEGHAERGVEGRRESGAPPRAEALAQWYLSPEQQRLFDEADAALERPLAVERAAAVSAAARVDGATFAGAVRRFHSESSAQLRKGKPNLTVGHASLAIDDGLTLKRRADGGTGLTLRAGDVQMTHLTFTPRIPLLLPATMLDAVVGRRIEEIVDKPFLRGSGLVVTRAWCHEAQRWHGGGASPERTCFELASDTMELDEAADLIDSRAHLRGG